MHYNASQFSKWGVIKSWLGDTLYLPFTLQFLFSVEVTILDILDLDEEDAFFTVYFDVKILWHDLRLQFRYLKDDKTFPNSSALDQIWKPELQFMHISKTETIDERIYIW